MAQTTVSGEQASPSQVDRVDRQVELARAEHGDDFDGTPLNVLLLMHRVMGAISRAESWEFEAIGMTGTSFNIAMVLHRDPRGMTMRELADAVSLAPSNLTAVVQDLERRGIVRRTPSASDGRVVEASLTEAGEETLRAFLPGHWNLLRALFEPLNHDDRRALIDMLGRMLAAITEPPALRGLSQGIVDAVKHDR